MTDNSEEFVYRRDGEEAEVVVYAPDTDAAERGFRRAMRAASVSGPEGPVLAASAAGYGHAARFSGSVAPEMASVPARGLFVSSEIPAGDFAGRLGVAEHQVEREIARRVGESVYGLPRMNARKIRKVCEVGAEASASEGVIEGEDLAFLAPAPGDADALGRRALLTGEREWGERPPDFPPLPIVEVLDADALEALGVEPGLLAFGLTVGAGDLGRLAFSLHRERIATRVTSRRFDYVPDPSGVVGGLVVAPADSEEARDFVSASGAASNFADAAAALWLMVFRRSLGGVVGGTEVRASWREGGVLRNGEAVVHHLNLAALGAGEAVVSGGSLCRSTGRMPSGAPTFAGEVPDGRWLWEEVGVLERVARLGYEKGRAMDRGDT